MPDDTGNPAVDDKVEAFSPEQEKYIEAMLGKQAETLTSQLTSHFGRISKEQVNKSFDEKVDPAKMEEQLSSQLFGGDVTGTVNKIMDARDAEAKRVRGEKLTAVEKEMDTYKDQPFFEDTKDEIKKIADVALEKGFPPGPAVELAVEKAKSAFLINRDPDLKLSMSGPGKQIKQTKKPKLPTELRAAAERDIQDGFFKDEAAYLEHLSPQMKAKYGI